MLKPNCDICKMVMKNRDCSKCVPDILPENQEAFNVYKLVQNQLITVGMGEPVDIDFRAIDFVMNLLNIENKKECFIKVLLLARTAINTMKEKNETQRLGSRNQSRPKKAHK